MELNTFLQRLNYAPDSVAFNDTIALIDSLYDFTPTAFKNGNLLNEAGKNNGSCRIFSFARLHGLSQQSTLHCFGDFYRKDVLGNPDVADHQNIRNFMRSGWTGIVLEGEALRLTPSLEFGQCCRQVPARRTSALTCIPDIRDDPSSIQDRTDAP